jgi:hypothetical protein
MQNVGSRIWGAGAWGSFALMAAMVILPACDAIRLTDDGGQAADAEDAHTDGHASDANRDAGTTDTSTQNDGATVDGAGDASANVDAKDAADADATADANANADADAASDSDAADGGTPDGDTSDSSVDSSQDAPAEASVASDASADANEGGDALPPPIASVCPTRIHDDWAIGLSCFPQDGQPWWAPLGSPSAWEGAMQLGANDVIRRVPLVDGYMLQFTLFLDGDADFFVGMPNVALDVPSFVRKGDKLILTGSHWDTTALVPIVEGDFDGREVSNGQPLVTVYVKATSKQCAVRATMGSVTYKSGFVRCANEANAIDGKDVSAPELTGNSSFTGGGYANIGVIDGCAGLTDGQLQTEYAK